MHLKVKRILLIIVIMALAAGSIVVAYTRFSSPCAFSTVRFTIIATEQGYNNSRTIAGLNGVWPTMRVHQGDVVCIHVINNEQTESHGFAISHYLDGSIGRSPVVIGTQSFVDVAFTADQTGIFRVYCTIPCFVHPFMQNGQLIVS